MAIFYLMFFILCHKNAKALYLKYLVMVYVFAFTQIRNINSLYKLLGKFISNCREIMIEEWLLYPFQSTGKFYNCNSLCRYKGLYYLIEYFFPLEFLDRKYKTSNDNFDNMSFCKKKKDQRTFSMWKQIDLYDKVWELIIQNQI